MVYKRYIYRNGKKFGPYYYHTYRDKKGNTHSKYIEDPKETRAVTDPKLKSNNHSNVFKQHKTLFILLAAIAVIFLSLIIVSNQVAQSQISGKETSGFSFNTLAKNIKSFVTGFTSSTPESVPSELASEAPSESGGSSSESSGGSAVSDSSSVSTTETPTEATTGVTTETSPVSPTNEAPPETSENTTQETPSTNETIQGPVINETLDNQTAPINESDSNFTINNETSENTTLNPPINRSSGEGAGGSISNITNQTTIINATNETLENITGILNETNFTIIENITNVTVLNETVNVTTQESLVQFNAVLGKPVKWEKTVKVDIEGANSTDNLIIDLPTEAGNVSAKKIKDGTEEELDVNVKNEKKIEETKSSITGSVTAESGGKNIFKGIFNFFLGFFRGMTARVVDVGQNEEAVQVSISDQINNNEQIVLEYYTEAPYAIEEDSLNGKKVKIVGSENIHYENVLAFTNLSESLNVKDKSKVKIYWEENQTYISPELVNDTNNNGIYDYLEWIAPRLSNQTFDIIVVTKAEHLDSNRVFISDIYNEIKTLDGVWSETINSGDYARVTFERNLTSKNDITIYSRTISGNPRIEVYEKDGNDSIAEFSNINGNEYSKVYLDGLQDPQDTFDLKVLNGEVQFDYIIDPSTVLQLGNNSIINDIYYLRLGKKSIQVMWDISTIPAGVTITDATFCMYANSVNDVSWDNDLNLTRVGNQTWTEIMTAASYISATQMSFTNSTLTNWSSVTALEYWCVNATSIIKYDYDLGNSRSSYRLVDPDAVPANSALGSILNSTALLIGGAGMDFDTVFQSRESTFDTVNRSYLNITYTGGTDNPPTWSSNSTNSTLAGTQIQHNVKWDDDTALSGYIFSFNNGSGTFTNDSFVSMIGTTNWSNVTKGVNTTIGTTIQWIVYANDSSNQWNSTSTFSYVTSDGVSPQWSLNSSNSTSKNTAVKHSVYWTDNVVLSGYIFSFDNGTGSFTNDTWISMLGAGNWSNVTKIANSANNSLVRWIVYANDSSNNWNNTDTFSYRTTNDAPTQANPIYSSLPLYNTQNATCLNQSTSDSNRDSVTNIYNWLINSSSIMILNMPFDTNVSLAGGSVKDYSGNNNNFTLNVSTATPTWVSSGKIGGAYSFDGADDSINSTSTIDLSALNKITVSFWVKPASSGTTNIFLEMSPNFNSYTDSFIVYFRSDQKIEFALRGNAPQYSTWISTSTLTPGTWTMLTATFDTSLSTQESKGYVNGVLDGAIDPSHNYDNNNNFGNRNVYIGARGGTSLFFNGTMDDVRIYNRSLSTAQIYQLYQDTKDGYSNSSTLENSEFALGNNLTCQVTPNDATDDGAMNSNSSIILGDPSIVAYTPVTDNFSIAEPSNQTFNIASYGNSTPISIFWFINGTEQIGSRNSTQYLWIGNYSQEGVYQIKVNISNAYGADDQIWIMTVNDTETAPTHNQPTLSPFPPTSSQNLTCYNSTTIDAEGDSVTNTYNWLINGTSMLLLNLPFDIDSSTLAKDYSGNGNNATITVSVGNPVWNSSGKIGGAYTFNKVLNPSGKIVIPKSASLNNTYNFSIDFWINPTDNTSAIVKYLFTNSNDVSIANDPGTISFYTSVDDFNIAMTNGSSSSTFSATIYNITNKNEWQHIALVQITPFNFSVYKNGVLFSTTTNNISGPFMTANNDFNIGFAYGDMATYGYNGSIDNFRIWNRSLSSVQVYQIYQDTKNGYSNSSTLVTNEFIAGNNLTCQVTPNDAKLDGITKQNSTVVSQAFSVAIDLSPSLTQQINWTLASLPIYNQSADGNNGTNATEYWINVSVLGGTADIFMKASDDLKTAGGDVLGLGNETYSYNTTNSSVPSTTKISFTTNYADHKVGDALPAGNTVIYLKFFLNAPVSQPAGIYNNTLLFKALQTGQSP